MLNRSLLLASDRHLNWRYPSTAALKAQISWTNDTAADDPGSSAAVSFVGAGMLAAALPERVADAILERAARDDAAEVDADADKRLGDLGANAREHHPRPEQLDCLGRAHE